MIVKRGAFLLLTSALAHQACTIETVDDDDDGGEGGTSAGTSAGGKAGSAGSAGSNSGGKSGAAGSAGSAAAGDAGAGGEGAASGEGPDAGEGGMVGGGQGGQAGEAPTGAGGEGGTPACDDSVGTPGDCTALDETDCSWERSYCVAAGMYLDPKVAQKATTCMLEDASCLTSGIDPYACVRTALEAACFDLENDAFCTEAVEMCSPAETINLADCHALVDGLNPDGFALVSSCVEDGCSFGLWSCVEGVQ
jgi:hypothetical protein